MKIPWTGSRCIVCSRLFDPNDHLKQCSEEHVIPDSIGGLLVVEFLCTDCNSRLGAMEADWRFDPVVRNAVLVLSGQIHEDLIAKLDDRQPYIVQSSGGPRPASVSKGRIEVNRGFADDGSLILPTNEAQQMIKKTLKRQGATEAETANALREFREAPEDQDVDIPGEWRMTKRTVIEARPVLNGRFVNRLAILKIAYEFLALHLGEATFEPVLDSVREALRDITAIPQDCHIEELRSREHRPLHELQVMRNAECATVQIRLFGALVYRVRFLRLGLSPCALGCIYQGWLNSGGEALEPMPGNLTPSSTT